MKFQEKLKNIQINDDLDIYKDLENLFNENKKQDIDNFWNLARGSALSFIDQSWKDHLSEMDYLRSGIGLRAMGQRDPLVEYQNEGYDLFEELINNVKFSSAIKGESLEDTYNRVIPYFENEIMPALQKNKNVIISAHGNSLRALVKFIEEISKEEIVKLEIATGEPIFYEFNEKRR